MTQINFFKDNIIIYILKIFMLFCVDFIYSGLILNQVQRKYDFNKLQKRLKREVGTAITDYSLIEANDLVMVCLSGGKDSYTMLDLLLEMKKHAPVNFSIVAVNLDQAQPGFPKQIIPEYLRKLGVEYHIIEEDTYSVVKELIPQGKTMCSLCSRLRRGILYTHARKIGANKIALGHHRDDAIETFFLNLFFGGQLKSMPPKLLSDDGKNIVIRPLVNCREKDIEKYAEYKQFPIIPCNLCGGQTKLQRQVVKKMLQEWDKKFPGRIETIYTALNNIKLSHLPDKNLFEFDQLKINK